MDITPQKAHNSLVAGLAVTVEYGFLSHANTFYESVRKLHSRRLQTLYDMGLLDESKPVRLTKKITEIEGGYRLTLALVAKEQNLQLSWRIVSKDDEET